MYTVYTRAWWKVNPNWPNGLEPHMGKKSPIKSGIKTIEEARKLCDEINKTLTSKREKRLGIKAEFSSAL